MCDVDEGLKIVPRGRALIELILPVVGPIVELRHLRAMRAIEEHITHRGTHVHDDAGEPSILHFRKVFLNVLLTVGKAGEVGCCINPDIAWLSRDNRSVFVAIPCPFAQDVLVILRAAS